MKVTVQMTRVERELCRRMAKRMVNDARSRVAGVTNYSPLETVTEVHAVLKSSVEKHNIVVLP